MSSSNSVALFLNHPAAFAKNRTGNTSPHFQPRVGRVNDRVGIHLSDVALDQFEVRLANLDFHDPPPGLRLVGTALPQTCLQCSLSTRTALVVRCLIQQRLTAEIPARPTVLFRRKTAVHRKKLDRILCRNHSQDVERLVFAQPRPVPFQGLLSSPQLLSNCFRSRSPDEVATGHAELGL